MKLFFSELILLITKKHERNIWVLVKFFLALILMVTVYSILFHFLMIFENREFSWITGFYWTLTVMSTLGFGDITFHTDPCERQYCTMCDLEACTVRRVATDTPRSG